VTEDVAGFLAELLQGVLLLAIIWWFGRGWVSKRLAARAARVGAALDEADAAEEAAARLDEEARVVVEQARRDAPELAHATQVKISTERTAAIASHDEEALALLEQARQTVEAEKARVLREASERLVQLTTEAARRYLEEALSEAEHRILTQKAIIQFLDDLEHDRDLQAAGGR
jgi:F-type H+-transporting ATPase subunit b